MKKLLLIGSFSGLFLLAFQNCGEPPRGVSSPSGSVLLASQATPALSAPAPTPSPLPDTAPLNTTAAPLACLEKDEPVAYNQPYFFYRKCDGEINGWTEIFRQQCCSKSVTIIDVQVFVDTQCADGRFEGIAVCN